MQACKVCGREDKLLLIIKDQPLCFDCARNLKLINKAGLRRKRR